MHQFCDNLIREKIPTMSYFTYFTANVQDGEFADYDFDCVDTEDDDPLVVEQGQRDLQIIEREMEDAAQQQQQQQQELENGDPKAETDGAVAKKGANKRKRVKTDDDNAAGPGTEPKTKKARKKRAPRRSKLLALEEAIKSLAEENVEENDEGQTLEREIRQQRAEALEKLEQLDRVLENGEAAANEIKRYKTLIDQCEKASRESKLLGRVHDVLRKMLVVGERSRAMCAKLPERYRALLVRHEAFTRSSVRALAVQGKTANANKFVTAAGAAAAAGTNGSQALVGYNRNQDAVTNVPAVVRVGSGDRAFELTMEHAAQYTNRKITRGYWQTSTMRNNFAPTVTATRASTQRIEQQRRAQRKRHARETLPALFTTSQPLFGIAPSDAQLRIGDGSAQNWNGAAGVPLAILASKK